MKIVNDDKRKETFLGFISRIFNYLFDGIDSIMIPLIITVVISCSNSRWHVMTYFVILRSVCELLCYTKIRMRYSRTTNDFNREQNSRGLDKLIWEFKYRLMQFIQYGADIAHILLMINIPNNIDFVEFVMLGIISKNLFNILRNNIYLAIYSDCEFYDIVWRAEDLYHAKGEQ